jgi:hypothetical protein
MGAPAELLQMKNDHNMRVKFTLMIGKTRVGRLLISCP